MPITTVFLVVIGSILNPLTGKFSEERVKVQRQGHLTIGIANYLSQYDWLKGSRMTKVVWLPKFRMKPIIHTANLWRQILPIACNSDGGKCQ